MQPVDLSNKICVVSLIFFKNYYILYVIYIFHYIFHTISTKTTTYKKCVIFNHLFIYCPRNIKSNSYQYLMFDTRTHVRTHAHTQAQAQAQAHARADTDTATHGHGRKCTGTHEHARTGGDRHG